MGEIKEGGYVKVENREVEVIVIQKGCLNERRRVMVEAIDLLRHLCE